MISDECIINLVTRLIFTRPENGVDREAWEQEKGESEGENKGEWNQAKGEGEGLITNGEGSNNEEGEREEVKENEGEYSQAGLYIYSMQNIEEILMTYNFKQNYFYLKLPFSSMKKNYLKENHFLILKFKNK